MKQQSKSQKVALPILQLGRTSFTSHS